MMRACTCVWCMCPCVHACVQCTDRRQPVLSFLREAPHFSFDTESLTEPRPLGIHAQTTMPGFNKANRDLTQVFTGDKHFSHLAGTRV